MVKVALVAQDMPELEAVRSRLRSPARFQLREYHSLDEVRDGLSHLPFDVLLLRISSFKPANIPMLVRARSAFSHAGVVLIAREIDPGARFQVRSMPGTKLIHEASEIDDLAGIIEQLNRGDSHPLRLHPRVKRDGHAELVDPKHGLKLQAKFLDFAQMGARIWVQAKTPLKRNDRFQVHYPSISEPGKTNRVEVTVVWQQMTSGMMDTIVRGPQQVVGIRFIAAL